MSTYLKDWHRDYVAESIKRQERNRWSTEPDFEWIKFAVECGRVAQLAREIGYTGGMQHITDVANTVQGIIAAGGNRKITDKQRYVLAVALAERFITARALAAYLWGLTDDEIDNADVR